ncbi:MAG: hypothetical protein ACI92S_002068 [Planctomycetaceae bacterium]|jgi:hypothetical protein
MRTAGSAWRPNDDDDEEGIVVSIQQVGWNKHCEVPAFNAILFLPELRRACSSLHF